MGLMDIAGQFLGGGQSQEDPKMKLFTAVMGMVQNQPGGVQGLLGKLQEGGLAEHAASWVGNGENLPVTGDQIHQALGTDQVQAIAQAAGIPMEHATSGLAAMLPEIINHLTPNGQVPQGGDAAQGLQAGLPSLLGKLFG